MASNIGVKTLNAPLASLRHDRWSDRFRPAMRMAIGDFGLGPSADHHDGSPDRVGYLASVETAAA
jgi:hypothetical protein